MSVTSTSEEVSSTSADALLSSFTVSAAPLAADLVYHRLELDVSLANGFRFLKEDELERRSV